MFDVLLFARTEGHCQAVGRQKILSTMRCDVTKKLFKILTMMTRDIKDAEFFSDDIFETIGHDDPDIYDISDELTVLETSGNMDDTELDVLKSLLVYILIRKSSLEKEDIYSLVFGGGRRITWS